MGKARLVRSWTVGVAGIVLAGALLPTTVAQAGTLGVAGPTPAPAPAVVLPPEAAAPTALDAPIDTGEWGPLLDWGQQAKHMTTLSTGKVLVWSTGDNARVWDPSTGTFRLTPATFGDLHCAGQSTLADGRVIVVGGQNGPPHDGTNITALFDPISETWTQGANMTDLRWYATSTTLGDGRVLATSGDAPDGSRSTVPEVYDPATDTWTRLTGAPRDQGLYPFMFVLPDGRAYEAGSRSSTATLDTSGMGAWTSGPTAPWSTSGYSESAVTYLPGRVLRAGGGDPAQASAAVIDMTASSPAWRQVGPMSFARRRMNLTILADGSVMAIGGTASGDSESAAVLAGEIWDPATETWTTVAGMAEARMYHSSAVLLPDGRIVVGGGEAAGRLRAQVYSPPYLFKGARPTITSAPGTAAFGATFSVESPDATSVASVALIRPSAATHAFDMNQRYVPLAFTRSGSTLEVTGPASGGIAPPGDYMLILKDTSGVPSVANWIRIGTAGSLQPGAISGTVTDAATTDPIAGVTVSTPSGSSTTDAQGRYTISGVPAGESVVTFVAAGYAQETRPVIVSGGQTTTLDVALTVPGSVAGLVTDAASGSALAGATITYPGGSTSTDAAGAYRIDGLAAGSRDLTFAALGYTGAQRTVTIQPNAVAALDVALSPSMTFVVGEVRDAATTAPIVGASVSISSGQTTTTDDQGQYRVDLPPGSYTLSVTAAGYQPDSGPIVISGGSYATLDFALTATAAPTTLTFTPTADAHVKSTSPNNNYGNVTSVRVRAGTSSTDATFTGFLQFDVAGLAGRTVTGASLRLYATDGGPSGGTVYRTSTAWTETGLTWANAPARVEPALASVGIVPTSAWIDVPLSAGVVDGDGMIAFRIDALSSNSVYYTSRQGTNAPQLRLVVDGGAPTPTPTPSPSPSPTPTASPTPTPTPTTGGTAIKDITFEGGLLHPQTGVDSVSGSVQLETANPIGGTASARINNTSAYLQETFGASPDFFLRIRIRMPGTNGASPRILMISSNGTTTANLVLLPTGRLRLRTGSTTIGAESAPMLVGSTYVIGLHQRRGTGNNGLVEAFLADDGSSFGAPFASASNGSWTGSTDRVRFGATTSTANLLLDDLLLADGAMPAALATTGKVVLAAVVSGSQPDRVEVARFQVAGPSTGPSFACPI